MKKRKLPEDDDGKVIAQMDVDGMPWYIDKLHKDGEGPRGDAYQMNKKESRSYMWGAMSAAFLVYAIFTVVFAAFILLLLFAMN